MGPGATATPDDCRRAFTLGQGIAQQGWVLLTGGRAEGVMDAANRGAKSAGGLTVGILPGGNRAEMSPAIDIPIVTAMGQGRNAINVLSSDVVLACGIGLGTASEIALALKEGKPVILLGAPELAYAFFSQCLSLTTPSDVDSKVQPQRLYSASTPEEAIAIMAGLLNATLLNPPIQ